MKLLLAPNAFKESLTAPEAARAMARGFRRAIPGVELVELPVADGGDGTAEALRAAVGGKRRVYRVTGPLGEPIDAPIIRLAGAGPSTDVIEMAAVAGLALVPPGRRNPMRTTTYGLGELIGISRRRRGARRIIVSLGGSATVDGGAGMAQALGFQLLDRRGRSIPPGGNGLATLARIIPPANWIGESEPNPEIIAVCDVRNPLLGPTGAARVFGPQKGATPPMIPRLESGLRNLASILRRDLQSPKTKGRRVDLLKLKGGGAAGGVGAGAAGFLGAELRPGADLVLELVRFREALAGVDWVITGEGRLDHQTLGGKAPAAVARMAKESGVPTIALAGSVEGGSEGSAIDFAAAGFAGCFSIVPGPMALEDALSGAARFLESACFQLGRIFGRKDDRDTPGDAS